MNSSYLTIEQSSTTLSLVFNGEFTLYLVSKYEAQIKSVNYNSYKYIEINLDSITYLDTAAAMFLNNLKNKLNLANISYEIISSKTQTQDTLALVNKYNKRNNENVLLSDSTFEKIGKYFYANILGFIAFINFLGRLFATKIHFIKNFSQIRYKEIFFEMNESAIKALGIVALTSFLIGLVVAYQSAYQLKIYGANIFIVDMLGLSILRELAPVITAIVIAGRSGSAFTAQIGAMKITQELDAMRTMGFDPYSFLVLPRIFALVIALPLLIFFSDIMGIFGGMVASGMQLNISYTQFIDRLYEVLEVKHYILGMIKGPVFAFVIAAVGCFRGLQVSDNTESIGLHTTASVVNSIFLVIAFDALFSVIYTELDI